jgi:hypothetical protein
VGDVDTSGNAVTLRELYQLVEGVQAKVLAEMKTVRTDLEAKLTLHQAEHARDADRRSSLTRWAVTAVISAAGVMLALYVAFRHVS